MDIRIQQMNKHALLPKTNTTTRKDTNSVPFKDVLDSVQQLKLSKHAEGRLVERNIEINPNQWEKINQKVGEAKQKGITDSLIVTKEAALVVSTKNNMVVTAMDRMEATSRIFTNINGTILIDE
ncbi:TIGR02530 family flagellar biosynthesis protein [Aquibacillus salsiterrae]|uniref:Flagellar protein n=1 Tax=Aquibacillus salsiterrae TaxID=2950439 RepID=A0A9X3WBB3_9BACI|nr:TIGR02530 family flagellar biosynthesis protein [Aquibacillus salsiterrae]MDC3416390.1 flagellar protein [Aquibacillus salsiterrae]